MCTAAWTNTAASSIWPKGPGCSAWNSPGSIPISAFSTRSTCAPTVGAASLTGRPTSTRASRASTISISITATWRISTPCRRSPTRARRAVSTSSRSTSAAARSAPVWTYFPEGTSSPTWPSTTMPVPAAALRPGCRTPTTNTPSLPCSPTAPKTIAAVCASSIPVSISPWSRAAPHTKMTTRPPTPLCWGATTRRRFLTRRSA